MRINVPIYIIYSRSSYFSSICISIKNGKKINVLNYLQIKILKQGKVNGLIIPDFYGYSSWKGHILFIPKI